MLGRFCFSLGKFSLRWAYRHSQEIRTYTVQESTTSWPQVWSPHEHSTDLPLQTEHWWAVPALSAQYTYLTFTFLFSYERLLKCVLLNVYQTVSYTHTLLNTHSSATQKGIFLYNGLFLFWFFKKPNSPLPRHCIHLRRDNAANLHKDCSGTVLNVRLTASRTKSPGRNNWEAGFELKVMRSKGQLKVPTTQFF